MRNGLPDVTTREKKKRFTGAEVRQSFEGTVAGLSGSIHCHRQTHYRRQNKKRVITAPSTPPSPHSPPSPAPFFPFPSPPPVTYPLSASRPLRHLIHSSNDSLQTRPSPYRRRCPAQRRRKRIEQWVGPPLCQLISCADREWAHTTPVTSPMLAESPGMPMEPAIAEASSGEGMSPNRWAVTTTSKRRGSFINTIAVRIYKLNVLLLSLGIIPMATFFVHFSSKAGRSSMTLAFVHRA